MPRAPEKISTDAYCTNSKFLSLILGLSTLRTLLEEFAKHKSFAKFIPTPNRSDEIEALRPNGIILSGGPASVLEKDAILCDKKLFEVRHTLY